MSIYSTGELAALFSNTHASNIAKITSVKLFSINSNMI